MDEHEQENSELESTPPSGRSSRKSIRGILGGSLLPGKNPMTRKDIMMSKRPRKPGPKKKPNSRGKSLKSPPDSPSSQDSPDAASLAQSNSPLASPFPGGWETLLPCENRKALPEIGKRKGRRCILEDTVLYYPQIYQQFISLLSSGVSINVACTCVGWNESTFHDWAYRGACDERDGKDTFFSRLHKDVRRAIASKTADCERQIADLSPTKWLTNGPGRIFGGRWSKTDPNKRALPGASGGAGPLQISGPGVPGHHAPATPGVPAEDHADILDASFIAVPSSADDSLDEGEGDAEGRGIGASEEKESDRKQSRATPSAQPSGMMTLQMSPEQTLEALKVWEQVGLVKLDPALSQAYDEQKTEMTENQESDNA